MSSQRQEQYLGKQAARTRQRSVPARWCTPTNLKCVTTSVLLTCLLLVPAISGLTTEVPSKASGNSVLQSHMVREVNTSVTSPATSFPFFDSTSPQNVTVTASKTALLGCRVHALGNNSVSWIRHHDLHIISVGLVTYTNDDRYRVVPNPDTGDWPLVIQYARPRDTGQYECQLSSRPTISRTVHLSVIEPRAIILRAPEMHVGIGSLINLTCVVPYSPEPLEYLHWYHKDKMVAQDGKRVHIHTTFGQYSVSHLLLRNARVSDSGTYTCQPAHSREHSITVHIITDGHPAAIQGGSPLTCGIYLRYVSVIPLPLLTILVSMFTTYFCI